MWFQDWQLTERMDSIRAAYRRAGAHSEIVRYELDQQVDQLVHGEITGPFTLLSPSDGDWWWIGNTFYVSYGPRDERLAGTLIRFTVGHRAQMLGNHQGAANNQLAGTGWIPIGNIFGQTTEPFFWPWPIRFSPGDYFTMELFSDGAGGVITRPGPFRFTYLGYKAIATPAAA